MTAIEIAMHTPPTFCHMYTQGGHFWSRVRMVQDGIAKFCEYKAQRLAQGASEDLFLDLPVFTVVMNNQACTMYNVEPSGRA
jgi:hypothetical protein